MSETKIQAACRKIALGAGCLWLRLRPPPAGVPDVLLVTLSGNHIWIEFKTPSGATRARQVLFAKELARLRAMHWYIRDVDSFIAALRLAL